MLIEMAQKEFIAEKRFEGLTENSLKSYTDFFSTWNSWLTEEGIEHIEELTPKVVKKYLMYSQQERGNSSRTINSKLKLMRTIARWLVEEGMTEELFTKGVKLQKQDDNPKILKEKDLQMVLKHFRRVKRREDSFTARRNYIVILFMAGSGLRLNEVTSLTWDDVSFDDYLITITKSKSRKRQSVPLSEMLARELLDWRLYLEKKFEGNFPEALFVTREGIPLSKSAIQNFFKRVKKKLDIRGDFSPHTLRNFYIKQLLKNGSNLREVQLLARHSKIDVTKQYVGYFQHELRDTLNKSNPLRDLL